MEHMLPHPTTPVKQDSPAFTLHIAPALALLPPRWRAAIAAVQWYDARNTPLRKFSRRISSGPLVPGITWKTSDGEIRAYLRGLGAAEVMHEAAHALGFAINFRPIESEPLLHVFDLAERTHRSVDPTFGGGRPFSYSLKNADEFYAQLLATTVTDDTHDPGHPLLHPCAEKLWPGSTPHLLAVEAAITSACERVLANPEAAA